MSKCEIAIIAAMEREVRPLIRSWKVRTIEHGGRRYRLFENGDAVLICGGIGAEAARRATEAVIQEVQSGARDLSRVCRSAGEVAVRCKSGRFWSRAR